MTDLLNEFYSGILLGVYIMGAVAGLISLGACFMVISAAMGWVFGTRKQYRKYL